MKEAFFEVNLSTENKNVVAQIDQFVKQGRKIDEVDENGDTLLMHAIKNKNLEAMKKILTYPQNLDIKNNWNRTALIRAASLNDTATVKLLLAKGAKTDIQDDDGMTAAISATINNNLEMITDLKKAKANFELKDKTGWSPLMWAINGNSFETAEKLIISVGVSVSDISEWMDKISCPNRKCFESIIKRSQIIKDFYKANKGR